MMSRKSRNQSGTTDFTDDTDKRSAKYPFFCSLSVTSVQSVVSLSLPPMSTKSFLLRCVRADKTPGPCDTN